MIKLCRMIALSWFVAGTVAKAAGLGYPSAEVTISQGALQAMFGDNASIYVVVPDVWGLNASALILSIDRDQFRRLTSLRDAKRQSIRGISLTCSASQTVIGRIKTDILEFHGKHLLTIAFSAQDGSKPQKTRNCAGWLD